LDSSSWIKGFDPDCRAERIEKNESEKMRTTMKFCVVMLALLLAGVGILPCVSADCACHHEDLQSQEEFKVVQPNTRTNLLDEFGLLRSGIW